MLRLLFVGVLVLVGCGPAIKPSMQAATDAKLAAYQTFEEHEAPLSYAPAAWKPGQWVAYRVTEQGQPPAVLTVKVVSRDAHGFWVETVLQDYYGRTVTQALYSAVPDDPQQALDELVKLVVKTDDEPAHTVDFRTGVTQAKESWRYVVAGLAPPQAPLELPRETVTVPAGRFEGAARHQDVVSFGTQAVEATSWFHPAVPLSGTVRSVAADGTRSLDLVAFGHTGGTSTLR